MISVSINSAFGDLREDKEFTDVTLACEDGGGSRGGSYCFQSVLLQPFEDEQTYTAVKFNINVTIARILRQWLRI